MTDTNIAFSQIDNPLLILFQFGGTVGLFLLFFYIRRLHTPFPQVVAATAISCLTDLVGRTMKTDWFFVADIVMFFMFGLIIWSAIWTVRNIQVLAAKLPAAEVIVPDRIDRLKWVVVVAVTVIGGGLLIYAYMDVYIKYKASQQSTAVAVVKENTKVRREQTKELVEADQKRDRMDAKLTSVLANQSTLGTGIKSLSVVAQKLATVLPKPAAPAKKMPAKTLPIRGMTTAKDTTRRQIKPLPGKESEPEKKGFWRRIFGRNDSLRVDSSRSAQVSIPPFRSLDNK